MQEGANILRIFQETKIAIEKEDTPKLRDLSDQTINTASRTHDPDNIATAVIIYALSKILERVEYKKQTGWKKFHSTILISLDGIIFSLEKNDSTKLRKNLQNIRSSIKGLSGDLKKYIQDVFMKAQINKASKIYEHGISMETTASLLGITMYDLASYAGPKHESQPSKKISAKQRIKMVEDIFK